MKMKKVKKWGEGSNYAGIYKNNQTRYKSKKNMNKVKKEREGVKLCRNILKLRYI